MIKRLKRLSQLNGKKRYIVMGLLAVELMSLPAAAKIVHAVSFETAVPSVLAFEIPTAEPGVTRFLVTSNSGFLVKANHMNGDVSVDIQVSGRFGGDVKFGDAAQLPGPKSSCALANGANSKIYQASRTTAAKPGTAPERAVVFEFQYSPEQHPQFEFTDNKASVLEAVPCRDTTI